MFEWQIGWALVRRRRGLTRGGFVSFIAAMAIVGIALGVAALVVVLAVVNGFEREVRVRLLDALPHVELQSFVGPADEAALPARLRAGAQAPRITAVAPYVQLQTLLGVGDVLRGVRLRGIDPTAEAGVSSLVARLEAGQRAALQPGAMRVLLGKELARALGTAAGGTVTLLRPGADAAAAPRFQALTVAGVFDSGYYEFDSLLALMHRDDVAALAGPAPVRGYALRLADAQAAPQVAAALRETLGPDWGVGDWTRANRTWFESVQIQKRMIGLILALIVAVAAFNLTSTLVMTVADRRGDIAILRTLGASPASVMAIFLVQGAASGLFGTLAGVGLGLAVALNLDRIVPVIESLAGRRLLDAQVYLIDRLPSDPRAAEIALIAAVSLALALVATLYPSWRASRVQPADALRQE
jgi:lipoprotein-releasing system permease protein